MNYFHAKRLAMGLAGVLLVAACGDDTTAPPAALGVPVNVEARALSRTALQVTWASVAGAQSYEVEIAEGTSGGTFANIGTSTTTSFDAQGLTTGSQYRFRVVAVDGTRRSSPSNPSAAVVVPDEIFSVVTADITSNRRFHADTTYVLSGFIKVANGATLTIDPGTRIVGDFQVPGSSLFILRGGRIMAEGTAAQPIVFTSEREPGQRQPGDWGGLIIIGNGVISRTGPTQIEGTGTPAGANPAQFYNGGTDNNDNSGVLRYVRIEFAGYPTAPNEELNSLTMAAVGAATRIEYVQVLQGLDDSFEWFGGAVNSKYLVSYEASDDHFDMSEGYIGRNQFVIAFQSIRPEPRPGLAGGVASDPQMVENDGCWAENCSAGDANRSASQPYTVPVLANFTLVGAPAGAWETTGGNYGMMLRRGVGGLYVNGVVTRTSRDAISLRGAQTFSRHDEGNMRIRNLYVSQTAGVFQTPTTASSNPESHQFALDLAANQIEAGSVNAVDLFTGVPASTLSATAASFNWQPASGSPIATGGLTDFSVLPQQLQNATTANTHPNSEIVPTAYRGAAAPGGPQWWAGWTNYARN
ncbi:MAG: fibronectin type III domain-containing protein [Gemmatimonadetes bacterium]|nr:fibronectin type III domain-containing protein [Gemmatimonadota bacterium]